MFLNTPGEKSELKANEMNRLSCERADANVTAMDKWMSLMEEGIDILDSICLKKAESSQKVKGIMIIETKNIEKKDQGVLVMKEEERNMITMYTKIIQVNRKDFIPRRGGLGAL